MCAANPSGVAKNLIGGIHLGCSFGFSSVSSSGAFILKSTKIRYHNDSPSRRSQDCVEDNHLNAHGKIL